jgi:hypothetical protein
MAEMTFHPDKLVDRLKFAIRLAVRGLAVLMVFVIPSWVGTDRNCRLPDREYRREGPWTSRLLRAHGEARRLRQPGPPSRVGTGGNLVTRWARAPRSTNGPPSLASDGRAPDVRIPGLERELGWRLRLDPRNWISTGKESARFSPVYLLESVSQRNKRWV